MPRRETALFGCCGGFRVLADCAAAVLSESADVALPKKSVHDAHTRYPPLYRVDL